jgi:hypothetical protein
VEVKARAMRIVSRWIVGYGLLLLLCNAMDALERPHLGLQDRALLGAWPGALLVIAAGLAAAQQRRSLRLCGLYVGIFLPLVLAGIYTWDASVLWGEPASSRLTAIIYTLLALASIATVWLVIRMRPRDGIASRGYAVAIHHAKLEGSQQADQAESRRRSEVG